ncbi:hypothetical protein IKE79_00120 [Candidatus Saccharibacteria bacterium]|nr:hypothetical protein [Candidatus Saccharibacteria bacterium]
MKVGLVYSRIASRVLAKHYPQMTANERRELLENGTLGEIEAMVDTREAISVAVHAIRRQLEVWTLGNGIYLPNNLVNIILTSQEPNEELADTTRYIARRGVSSVRKGEIAYRTLEALHDWRVQRSAKRFFDGRYADKKYWFLPSQMIGFSNLLEEYIYCEDILAVLTLRPETWDIEMSYEEEQKHFLQLAGGDDLADMAEFVQNMGYAAQPVGVIASIRADPDLAREVARQAMSHLR